VSCTHGPNCDRKVVVLGPLFSKLRVILGPSLASPEWRLFVLRSGIIGLNIQNNFWYPFERCKMRHSFSHFDQIRIVLGLIMVSPEWRWFLKSKILYLQIWNRIWILIASEDVMFLGPFFSTSRHSRPTFHPPRMKAIWKKLNYGFKNTK